ncbi:MAG: hypothetical protein ACLFQ5_03955 [Oceanicaulis sp.]
MQAVDGSAARPSLARRCKTGDGHDQGLAGECARAKFELTEYDPGALAADDVEIAVKSCGLCHSDMSLHDDEWGISQFPLTPRHLAESGAAAHEPDRRGVRKAEKRLAALSHRPRQ